MVKHLQIKDRATLCRDENPGEGLLWECRWHLGGLSVDSRSSANGNSKQERHQLVRAQHSCRVAGRYCVQLLSLDILPPQCMPVVTLLSRSDVLVFEPA